ncbi:MAG: methyltransferase [Zetaproteobacteria bacterium]|nr:MAG: methyltransferase [Zetaproteobacteria bacterium]
MDLKEEDILGDKIHGHWYYVSKGKAMRCFLGNIKTDEVLDVGAGSGIFSRQLLDHNICQSAVCVDPNYDEEKEESQNGKPIKFVKSIEKTTQGLTLMMDVLEHVEDDVALLKEYADSMPKNGKVLITVPAFQFMWSGHDVFLEHYRRYTIEMMEKTIREAGLRPVKSRYFFGSLFPVVAVIRFVKKILFNQGKIEGKSELKLYSDNMNKTLIALHDVELMSLFSFNKLFGLSVFCLCEKV